MMDLGFVARMLGRGPRHCTSCGDAYVTAQYGGGYRRSDGTPIIRRWSKCPRNDDCAPSRFEVYDPGRCHGLSPFACSNERRAYAEHRPERGACSHTSVAEDGRTCWDKDGHIITGASVDVS